MTGENDKYNYSKAAHLHPPFSYIPCSAKNCKIAPALTSIKALTQGQINEVARVLQNMKDGVSRSTRPKRTDEGGDARTIQQRRKIYALTESLGWNDNPQRIQGFVKRMTGVDRLEWLNVAQCEKVIEGLKAILKRQERKEGEG